MNARRAYKLNHADIRAFGRFAKTPEERAQKIAAACRDRAFWLSDPATSAAGVAALRVLNGSMREDMLAGIAAPASAGWRECAPCSASELRSLSYRFYREGRLPR